MNNLSPLFSSGAIEAPSTTLACKGNWTKINIIAANIIVSDISTKFLIRFTPLKSKDCIFYSVLICSVLIYSVLI